MQTIQWPALLSFVLITTLTPGPNNIACASLGIRYGYRKALPFILGIVSAFFLIMLGAGLLSSWLQTALPNFESIVRVIGAAYIMWLAWHSIQASYDLEMDQAKVDGYARGFALSILNPKAIVFGLSVHGAFLNSIADDLLLVVFASIALASMAFLATSAWALFGAGIRQWLDNPRVVAWLNRALALLLVYTAIEISGLRG
jgi:cysteine/O-acetylserine efflux protein